jgi:hypothetical protein
MSNFDREQRRRLKDVSPDYDWRTDQAEVSGIRRCRFCRAWDGEHLESCDDIRSAWGRDMASHRKPRLTPHWQAFVDRVSESVKQGERDAAEALAADDRVAAEAKAQKVRAQTLIRVRKHRARHVTPKN